MSRVAERRLGQAGPMASAFGLGCMSMSGVYGASDEAEALATIHEALDAGITLFDTGDFYGMGHNEILLGRALQGRRDGVLISVKFGAMRGPDGSWLGTDGRPKAVRNFVAYSLQRLKTGHIDIYRLARVDPAVPIEETVGAIADLVKQGYVRYIGLSEAGAATVRRAHAVHPICDLQIEYSLASRGIEREILPALRELGIAVTAYGVLSRGLLAGSRPAGKGDFRTHFPRFAGPAYQQNQQLVAELARMAASRGTTAAQLATAWVIARGGDIVPLIGARTRAQLRESLGAAAVELTPEETARLEEVFGKVAGTRYAEEQMRTLDSEQQAAGV